MRLLVRLLNIGPKTNW